MSTFTKYLVRVTAVDSKFLSFCFGNSQFFETAKAIKKGQIRVIQTSNLSYLVHLKCRGSADLVLSRDEFKFKILRTLPRRMLHG